MKLLGMILIQKGNRYDLVPRGMQKLEANADFQRPKISFT